MTPLFTAYFFTNGQAPFPFAVRSDVPYSISLCIECGSTISEHCTVVDATRHDHALVSATSVKTTSTSVATSTVEESEIVSDDNNTHHNRSLQPKAEESLFRLNAVIISEYNNTLRPRLVEAFKKMVKRGHLRFRSEWKVVNRKLGVVLELW